ncbi:MAG: hypothetical protein H6559_36630 [Lewinellaceae bacterium]|nr:hypothetical protein [Lewinellaceae bacterium]
MNIQKIRSMLHTLLAFCLILGFAAQVSAQRLDRVYARFANPQFDQETRGYTLDVELRSDQENQFLFGMNVRFFYDATKLEFQSFDDFHPGYGTLGASPSARKGTPTSGLQLFDFSAEASFVNSAIQLQDESTPMKLQNTHWKKAFRLNFRIPESVDDHRPFCPSVLWDLKATPGAGSFLAGSDGLVVTLLDRDPASRQVSAPTLVKSEPFNWAYGAVEAMPYGNPKDDNCTPLSQLVSSSNTVIADEKGYALFQNQPNPFAQGTRIEFVLPDAMEAHLVFYDVTGKLLKVLEGDYAKGLNAVNLDRQEWMGQSNVILYQLKTTDHTSGMRKMTLVNQ